TYPAPPWGPLGRVLGQGPRPPSPAGLGWGGPYRGGGACPPWWPAPADKCTEPRVVVVSAALVGRERLEQNEKLPQWVRAACGLIRLKSVAQLVPGLGQLTIFTAGPSGRPSPRLR